MKHTFARELQDCICDVLNANETLVKGGCKAFAEAAGDIMGEITRQLAEVRGVAAAVTTPSFAKAAEAPQGDGVWLDGVLSLRFSEKPALNRLRPGRITALDAALEAAAALNPTQYTLETIEQTADEAGVVTVEARFAFTAHISGEQ